MLGAGAGLAAEAAGEPARHAALTPGADPQREAELPSVLGTADAIRYRSIFRLQEDGRWPAADRVIALVEDRMLMGPVLAQRYLHPGYRGRYGELRDWLASYGDEPEARAIYAAALKRQPAGAQPPARPTGPTLPVPAPRAGGNRQSDLGAAADRADARRRDAADLERTRLKEEIARIAPGDPRRAAAILAGGAAKRLLDKRDMDDARGILAQAYLSAGDARRALAISTGGEGADLPAAEWEAALAAWRLDRFGEARHHFEATAKSGGIPEALVAAASFWAARAELRSRRPELVNYWLGIAAAHPHSFYGLLARRTLGVDTYFDFEAKPFADADAGLLLSVASGRRALALIQVGESLRAEAELRALAAHADPGLLQALEALADCADLPALSLQLAASLADSDGRAHDRSLFPVPRWTPRGGFTVDRALIFALMRQESQFLAHVQSPAGAIGLMQIMPATARSIARRAGLAVDGRGDFADPEINLMLAQEYIGELQQSDRIKDNLVLLAAAYNSGPGPIQRWMAAPKVRQDPLLFLESIPSRETRSFTQKVLANYWIYRLRLAQPTPDLDALARGNWPTYTALDTPSEQASQYAANR